MDVDLIFKIAAIGIIVAVLNQVLIRSGREEQAMLTTLAGLIVVLMMIIGEISTASLLPVLQEVLSISLLSDGVAENIGTLFKCLGICYVVQLSADSCRDAGQQAIASKVELAGKVAVLALALPMLKTVVSFLDDLIFL